MSCKEDDGDEPIEDGQILEKALALTLASVFMTRWIARVTGNCMQRPEPRDEVVAFK